MSNYFPLAFLLLLMTSCRLSDGKEQHKIKVYSDDTHILSHYHFELPDATLKLNSVLREISGLSYDASTGNLLAVNDEQGMLYELEAQGGKVIGDHEFRGSGDYEGVEVVGNDVYVLKSNGKLYRVGDGNTDEIKTPLSLKNDVEGLAYQEEKHQLLLACKAKPLDDHYAKGSKAIYAYDLEENSLIEKPFLLIKRKTLTKFLEKKGAGESALKRVKRFSPSGIAIHPLTKQIYIISAIESAMLVYSPEHKLIQCVFLDRGVLPQPEGVCFSSDGTLFLSTEGQGTRGKISIYHPE